MDFVQQNIKIEALSYRVFLLYLMLVQHMHTLKKNIFREFILEYERILLSYRRVSVIFIQYWLQIVSGLIPKVEASNIIDIGNF